MNVFFEMRKSLEIEPYNFYDNIDKLKEKMKSQLFYMLLSGMKRH